MGGGPNHFFYPLFPKNLPFFQGIDLFLDLNGGGSYYPLPPLDPPLLLGSYILRKVNKSKKKMKHHTGRHYTLSS